MRRLLYLLFIIAFAVHPVFAFEMEVSDETVKVITGKSKSINITLSTLLDEKIALSIISPKPWMLIGGPQPILRAGETRSIAVYFSPFIDTPPASYKITLAAKSMATGVDERKDLIVTVVRGANIILEKVTVGGNLEPTGTANVKFYIQNNGRVAANTLVIKLLMRSGNRILHTSDEHIDRADPYETTIVEKNVNMPPSLESGIYMAITELYQDGKLIGRNEQPFVVKEKVIFSEEYERKDVIFGYGKTIRIKNLGNVVGEKIVDEEISGFLIPFLYAGDDAYVSSNKITWNIVSLGPGEEITLSYLVDYSIIILVVIVLIIIGWFVMFKLRTVKIRKYVIQKNMIEKGAEFTIGIDIKNSLGRDVKNILVKDFIPGVFKLAQTPGPKYKKRKMHGGTEIAWKINQLNKSEERILSYKLIPMFGIHGQIRLPRASVKFSSKKTTIENKSDFTLLGITAKDKFV